MNLCGSVVKKKNLNDPQFIKLSGIQILFGQRLYLFGGDGLKGADAVEGVYILL